MEKIRYFIGWDSHEEIAYEVCKHSCKSHFNKSQSDLGLDMGLDIKPLKVSELRASNVYLRPRDPRQSTEFTYLRFLVPQLCDYTGWAIFTDDDMMWRESIAHLWNLRDESKAVMVVQHPDFEPTQELKLADKPQTNYRRKNWSSVILWNCGHAKNRQLTTETVRDWSAQDLHQFNWLADSEIGSLPSKFNHLVGYYPEPSNPALVHWTDGGPWFPEYSSKNVPYMREWFAHMRAWESLNGQESRLLGPFERYKAHLYGTISGYPNSGYVPWTWAMDESQY